MDERYQSADVKSQMQVLREEASRARLAPPRSIEDEIVDYANRESSYVLDPRKLRAGGMSPERFSGLIKLVQERTTPEARGAVAQELTRAWDSNKPMRLKFWSRQHTDTRDNPEISPLTEHGAVQAPQGAARSAILAWRKLLERPIEERPGEAAIVKPVTRVGKALQNLASDLSEATQENPFRKDDVLHAPAEILRRYGRMAVPVVRGLGAPLGLVSPVMKEGIAAVAATPGLKAGAMKLLDRPVPGWVREKYRAEQAPVPASIGGIFKKRFGIPTESAREAARTAQIPGANLTNELIGESGKYAGRLRDLPFEGYPLARKWTNLGVFASEAQKAKFGPRRIREIGKELETVPLDIRTAGQIVNWGRKAEQAHTRMGEEIMSGLSEARKARLAAAQSRLNDFMNGEGSSHEAIRDITEWLKSVEQTDKQIAGIAKRSGRYGGKRRFFDLENARGMVTKPVPLSPKGTVVSKEATGAITNPRRWGVPEGKEEVDFATQGFTSLLQQARTAGQLRAIKDMRRAAPEMFRYPWEEAPADWVRLPMKSPQDLVDYGEAAGMKVEPHYWQSVLETAYSPKKTGPWLRRTKFWQTAGNLPSHPWNVATSGVALHTRGMPAPMVPVELARGIKTALSSSRAAMKEKEALAKLGITGSDLEAEAAYDAADVLAKRGLKGELTDPLKLREAIHAGGRENPLVKFARRIYGAEDFGARIAGKRFASKHLTPADEVAAAKWGTENIGDFGDVTSGVKMARSSNWALPYITFPLKMLTFTGRTISEGKLPRLLRLKSLLDEYNVERSRQEGLQADAPVEDKIQAGEKARVGGAVARVMPRLTTGSAVDEQDQRRSESIGLERALPFGSIFSSRSAQLPLGIAPAAALEMLMRSQGVDDPTQGPEAAKDYVMRNLAQYGPLLASLNEKTAFLSNPALQRAGKAVAHGVLRSGAIPQGANEQLQSWYDVLYPRGKYAPVDTRGDFSNIFRGTPTYGKAHTDFLYGGGAAERRKRSVARGEEKRRARR